jgi:hypothetical protein
MPRPARTVLTTLAWLAIVVVIALGAAGIVTGMDRAPSETGPAASFDGDPEVTARLDAVSADLSDLDDQVDALGTHARNALAALNGADPATAETEIAAGDTLVGDIVQRTAAIRSKLAVVPFIGTADAGLHLSDGVLDRDAALEAALAETDGLDAGWARLSISAIAASKTSQLLAAHDQLMGQALAKGRLAKYADADKLITQAGAQLTTAKSVRDDLAKTVDVTVLDEWIRRNENYDTALRNLYKAISKVGRTVTPAVRNAVKAEKTARAQLPPDAKALVVIMADIGRGGMNQAVIGIEEARATLADAIDRANTTPDASPDAGPGASESPTNAP